MENIPFFIQARTNATRLPKKLLLPFFEGKTILQLLLDRLIKQFPRNSIYLLTTNSGQDDDLVKAVSDYSIEVFRGSEENVLARFLSAGDRFNAENIMRICADNPFLDMGYLKNLLAYNANDVDYLSYSVLGKPAIKCHYGLFAERTKISALRRIPDYSTDRRYSEHVTNFIYENPHLFTCKFLEAGHEISALDGIRLTVDTIEDFKNAQFIFERLENPLVFTTSEIAGIFKSSTELEESMSNEIKYNSK